ncbi:MAG: nuclear transport factor 2 family protein [Terrimesophilobacter sp.]
MEPSPARPDRALISILALIALIVVIAVIVVFTRGGAPDVDPTTPEGAVQSYTRAVIDSDYKTALLYVSSDLRENCERAEPRSPDSLRMTVISQKVVGDTAVVRVTVEQGSGAYGGSSYQYDDTFSLIQEDGGWKITMAPWDLTACQNQGMHE